MSSGSDVAGEGVALSGFAGLEAAFEPVMALGRGAVGKRIRVHAAAPLGLKPVVPDRLGSIYCLIKVARLKLVKNG